MSRLDLLAEAGLLTFGFTALSAWSWWAGRSVLVFHLVSKAEEPVRYWTATLLNTGLAFVGAVAVLLIILSPDG